MVLDWSSKYVGIPWEAGGRSLIGCECWPLVTLVLQRERGVEAPDYAGFVSASEKAEIAALFDDRHRWPWVPVPQGQERPFDVAVFRRGRHASHAGIVVRPGFMLHTVEGGESHVEPYDTGRWAPRLLSLHRHASLA